MPKLNLRGPQVKKQSKEQTEISKELQVPLGASPTRHAKNPRHHDGLPYPACCNDGRRLHNSSAVQHRYALHVLHVATEWCAPNLIRFGHRIRIQENLAKKRTCCTLFLFYQRRPNRNPARHYTICTARGLFEIFEI